MSASTSRIIQLLKTKGKQSMIPLTSLTQGSTLSITQHNSKKPNELVVPPIYLTIQSSWRDDGYVTLFQNNNDTTRMNISKRVDQKTSIGRMEPHISIELLDQCDIQNEKNNDTTSQQQDEKVLEQIQKYYSQPNLKFNNQDNIIIDPSALFLFVQVPEKVNIDCKLKNGSIDIPSKIEGDVTLVTNDNPINVSKLRGHVIDIQNGNGKIRVSDVIEAQQVHMQSNQRIRAKRIHANTVEIKVNNEAYLTDSKCIDNNRYDHDHNDDDDDVGALCDVSSFYISGQAIINVTCNDDKISRTVRVKSNHGPITVESTKKKNIVTTSTNEPTVELSGVNGSCEIYMQHGGDQQKEHGTTLQDTNTTTCQVHFDSLSPDTISIIQANQGNVSISFDRKIESDIRMLSSTHAGNIEMDDLLIDNDDNTNNNELIEILKEIDQQSNKNDTNIDIQTQTFTSLHNESESPLLLSFFDHIKYAHGWIENKSQEPASRFDRKIGRREGGEQKEGGGRGGGKINIHGAAAQALERFQSTKSDNNDTTKNNDFIRPLVAVATNGNIKIETLSWLGNIARRYGLENSGHRDEAELGRTATRRGRSFIPPTFATNEGSNNNNNNDNSPKQ